MSIEPAGEALLADARAQAQRVLEDADDECEERLAGARRRAAGLLADAREQGDAEGRVEADREQALEGLLARTEVLAAQRRAYEELEARARAAVLDLRGEPDYAELLERLSAAVRRDLGDAAQLEIDPPDVGGVRGTAGSLHADYTLVTLAEGCVRDLGPGLRRLWT